MAVHLGQTEAPVWFMLQRTTMIEELKASLLSAFAQLHEAHKNSVAAAVQQAAAPLEEKVDRLAQRLNDGRGGDAARSSAATRTVEDEAKEVCERALSRYHATRDTYAHSAPSCSSMVRRRVRSFPSTKS